jgi:hypothetical protein
MDKELFIQEVGQLTTAVREAQKRLGGSDAALLSLVVSVAITAGINMGPLEKSLKFFPAVCTGIHDGSLVVLQEKFKDVDPLDVMQAVLNCMKDSEQSNIPPHLHG